MPAEVPAMVAAATEPPAAPVASQEMALAPEPAPVIPHADPTAAPIESPTASGSPAIVEERVRDGAAELVAIPNARNRRGSRASSAPVSSASQGLDDVGRSSSESVQRASPTVAASAEILLHTVRSGENFWTISRYYYGSGRFWKALWAANSAIVPAPEKLEVGMTIKVPMPEALDRSLVESTQDEPQDQPPPTGVPQPSRLPSTRDEPQDQPAPPPGRRSSNRHGSTDTEPIPTASPRLTRPVSRVEPVSEPARGRIGLPVYTVRRSNETLRSIARDVLGDPERSAEILELNGDAIPARGALRPGTSLRLPADATLEGR
jgi:nucleoid-associated protein YgaU